MPDGLTFTIAHSDPRFHLERTLTFGDRTDSFAIDLTVGGEPVAITRGDAIIHPSINWDGDDLVFRTHIVKGTETATNLVRYRLDADETMLVAEEQFRSSAQNYDNRWVFSKD